MKAFKKMKRQFAGFKGVTLQEFLSLSDEDMALIDLKVTLVTMLKATRDGITQHKLAKLMSSSQSRVAKLEGACADASLDLICRALFAVGITPRQIGRTIASNTPA